MGFEKTTKNKGECCYRDFQIWTRWTVFFYISKLEKVAIHKRKREEFFYLKFVFFEKLLFGCPWKTCREPVRCASIGNEIILFRKSTYWPTLSNPSSTRVLSDPLSLARVVLKYMYTFYFFWNGKNLLYGRCCAAELVDHILIETSNLRKFGACCFDIICVILLGRDGALCLHKLLLLRLFLLLAAAAPPGPRGGRREGRRRSTRLTPS